MSLVSPGDVPAKCAACHPKLTTVMKCAPTEDSFFLVRGGHGDLPLIMLSMNINWACPTFSSILSMLGIRKESNLDVAFNFWMCMHDLKSPSFLGATTRGLRLCLCSIFASSDLTASYGHWGNCLQLWCIMHPSGMQHTISMDSQGHREIHPCTPLPACGVGSLDLGKIVPQRLALPEVPPLLGRALGLPGQGMVPFVGTRPFVGTPWLEQTNMINLLL